MPEEQRLFQQLMKDYEPSVRPVRNSSRPVIAKMGITLTQIFDMDEKNQILVTNVWLDQQWYDEYLQWKPEDFPTMKKLRLPSEKIWKPDIVLYNNAADFADKMMPALAMIKSDGEVFWPVPTKLKSSCKIDVTYFPFDSQICKLKFGSWTYDGLQVELDKLKDVDLDMYVENGEWKLTKTKVLRNSIVYTCCPEPYYDVTFVLYLERRILYFIYHVIYPCIMMSALTLLVFCLPPDSGEKIALGITVLLAFSVLMLSIAEKLPETSESVPLISIYLTTVMSMTSVSVIMTVLVLNLHHRGPNKSKVPKWLQKLMYYTNNRNQRIKGQFKNTRFNTIINLRSIETLIRNINKKLSFNPIIQVKPFMNSQTKDENHQMKYSNLNNSTNINLSSFPTMETDIISEPATIRHEYEPMYISDNDYRCMEHVQLSKSCSVTSSSNNGACFNVPLSRNDDKEPNSRVNRLFSSNSISCKCNFDLMYQQQEINERILNALNKILIKNESDALDINLVYEWKSVAQFVDRVLFWIYLFSTLTSTIIILVIAPLYGIIPIHIEDPQEITMNITTNSNISQQLP